LTASVAATAAIRLTAEFKMPDVSHVSTNPVGESGKMHAIQAVSPGITFNVTP
jgi:hypothetical protein